MSNKFSVFQKDTSLVVPLATVSSSNYSVLAAQKNRAYIPDVKPPWFDKRDELPLRTIMLGEKAVPEREANYC